MIKRIATASEITDLLENNSITKYVLHVTGSKVIPRFIDFEDLNEYCGLVSKLELKNELEEAGGTLYVSKLRSSYLGWGFGINADPQELEKKFRELGKKKLINGK